MSKHELYYSGSKEKLFKDIARVNGKRTEKQQFSCVLCVPTNMGRSKQCFRFLCQFQKCDDRYRVTYRIAPTLSVLRLVFALAVLGAGVIWALQERDFFKAIFGLILLLGTGISYFMCRKECIQEFEKRFGK